MQFHSAHDICSVAGSRIVKVDARKRLLHFGISVSFKHAEYLKGKCIYLMSVIREPEQ